MGRAFTAGGRLDLKRIHSHQSLDCEGGCVMGRNILIGIGIVFAVMVVMIAVQACGKI